MPAIHERHPHLATRAVVDTLGQEAPRVLYKAFDAFNAEHFGGALGAPLILITPPVGGRAWGDYTTRDVHGLRSTIRIAPSSFRRGERFAIDVLLHEMIHAWQSEVQGDIEPGYRGHGPVFAAKCNELGTKLGLPPVGVKGRKGLPDCAQWPICVRPAGYYPSPPPPKKPKPTRPRPPTTEKGDVEGGLSGLSDALRQARKEAFEAGSQDGARRARLHFAKQVRRRARRLRLAYGESNPRLAALVIAEAETIAHAIASSDHVFYKMNYPGKRTRKGADS